MGERTTITEALAELKVIDKRIGKKREFVLTYLLRQEQLKDPHAKDGGSVEAIKRELQAVGDLEERAVGIRRAINVVNLATAVTINGKSRSIAEWIIWRREIAPKRTAFLTGVSQGIERTRADLMKKGVPMLPASTADAKPSDVIVNINEQELAKWREEMDATLEILDGQLSLKNATTTIEV